MHRGKEFYEKGQYADAEIQFRKALQEDSRYGEAFLDLGRTEEKRRNYPSAFDSLRRAMALMPGQDAPKIEYGNLVLVIYLGDPTHPAELYNEISRISEELLKRDPKSFDGLRLRAYLANADGNSAKAAETLEEANRLRPDQPDVITLLCESLMRTRKEDRAEQIARAFLKKQPAYGPLYSMLYEYYRGAGRLADAESILREKVANNPGEGLFRIELARHYARSGKSSDMARVLTELLADPHTFPHAHLEVGDFYMGLGHLVEARRQFSEGVQNDKQLKVTYLKRLVRLDLATNHLSDARNSLEQILQAQPDDIEAQASRAAVQMASNDPSQRKLAIAGFAAIVKKAPGAAYRYQYAEALRADGQTEAARQQYLEVIRTEPRNTAALQALADLSIRGERLDEALDYASRVLALDPASVRARLVQSAAFASRGRLAETRSVLSKLIREHPELREAQLQYGLLQVAEKQYADAEARFRKYYQPGTGDVRSLEGFVELYRAQHRLDEAVALLKQDLEKGPQSNAVRVLLARTAAQAQQNDLAVADYREAARREPDSPAIAIEFGLACQAKGDLTGAISEFERAEKLDPGNARVPAYLGRALDEAGRKPEAILSYRRSLAQDGRDAWVMNNLAYLLAETGGDLNEALKLADTAARQYPGNLLFSDTVGWVYLRKRDLPHAIEVFSKVRDQNPNQVEFRIHLTQALLASGHRDRALSELEAARTLPATPEQLNAIKRLRAQAQAD